MPIKKYGLPNTDFQEIYKCWTAGRMYILLAQVPTKSNEL